MGCAETDRDIETGIEKWSETSRYRGGTRENGVGTEEAGLLNNVMVKTHMRRFCVINALTVCCACITNEQIEN